jgi:hypothetical protein
MLRIAPCARTTPHGTSPDDDFVNGTPVGFVVHSGPRSFTKFFVPALASGVVTVEEQISCIRVFRSIRITLLQLP